MQGLSVANAQVRSAKLVPFDVPGGHHEQPMGVALRLVQVDEPLCGGVEGTAGSQCIYSRRPRCWLSLLTVGRRCHCHGEHAPSERRLGLRQGCRLCGDGAVEIWVVRADRRQDLYRLEPVTENDRTRRLQHRCEIPMQCQARHLGSVSLLPRAASVVMGAPRGIDRGRVLNRQSGRNERVGLGDAGIEQTHGRSIAGWRRQPCGGVIRPQRLFSGWQINKESARRLRPAKLGEVRENI